MNDEEQKIEDEAVGEPQEEKPQEDYLEGWKRALADYENLKKTTAGEKQLWGKMYTTDIVSSFIPLYDYLVAATNVPVAVTGIEQWVTGVKMVLTEFERIISQYGVKKIPTVGTEFNPHLHESVGTEKDEIKKDHEVLKELQAGFVLDERVIRPAKVVINQL